MSSETTTKAETLNESPNKLPALETHVDNNMEIAATAPGEYRVIRRNGKVTSFDGGKIKVAITKAFLAVEGNHAAASNRVHSLVDQIGNEIVSAVTRLSR